MDTRNAKVDIRYVYVLKKRSSITHRSSTHFEKYGFLTNAYSMLFGNRRTKRRTSLSFIRTSQDDPFMFYLVHLSPPFLTSKSDTLPKDNLLT